MSNMPVTPRQQRGSAAGSPRTLAHGTPMSERQQMALLMQMTSQQKPPTPPINPGEERRRNRQQRNERGETPLHIAAKKGDQEQVQKLLEQGVSPDVTDFAGWTPLHEACSYGWYQVVQTLVQSGANVNARGLDDDTPLHDAASTGNLQMVKFLVENGADPCAKNNMGKMPSDFSSQLIYDYLVSIKETAGTARSAHANKKSNVLVADSKRTMDGLAASDSFDVKDGALADKPAEAKDDTHGQLSSTVVSSTQEDTGSAPPAEGDPADASDEEGGKRKKRKEEPVKETAAKPAQPPRGTASRMLPGTKPPGPASKTGAVPLGKNSQGSSGAKPGAAGTTVGKSAPGPAAKTAALAQGKSASVVKGGGSVSTPSKGPERKSPEDTLKPNAAKESMEVDGEETKTQESSGPKVPPLKIVIPGGVGGGGGGAGATQEGEGCAGRGGGGKGRGSAGTLPYVMPCISEGSSNNGGDSNDDDKKNSGDEKRVLRSHRTTDEKDKEDRTPPPSAASSAAAPVSAAPPAVAAPPASEASAPARASTVTQEEATATSTSVTTTTAATTSSSSTWSSGATSNELHPRKRKIRASKESHQRDSKEQPAEASAGGAAAETQPALHSNPYQQYIDIRKQIERRQKGLFPVQPKPPQGFKDYLMNRGTYLLQRNIKPMPAVTTPANLPAQMRDQYVKHEKERHNLKIQHIIEKEKLVLSVEQEILRVHGRAARALANQALPFSACTILRDKEVYNAITPEQEEKERNAQRSRYNGRLFLSWLQDVDDKWEKIKEGMVRRHHTEAETLHAVQKMQWEWRLKEFGLCDYKSTPKIEPSHVPQVHVSDDFDLLPA